MERTWKIRSLHGWIGYNITCMCTWTRQPRLEQNCHTFTRTQACMYTNSHTFEAVEEVDLRKASPERRVLISTNLFLALRCSLSSVSDSKSANDRPCVSTRERARRERGGERERDACIDLNVYVQHNIIHADGK